MKKIFLAALSVLFLTVIPTFTFAQKPSLTPLSRQPNTHAEKKPVRWVYYQVKPGALK
jgi:hypothetical protein